MDGHTQNVVETQNTDGRTLFFVCLFVCFFGEILVRNRVGRWELTLLLCVCRTLSRRVLTIQGNLEATLNVIQNVLPSLEEVSLFIVCLALEHVFIFVLFWPAQVSKGRGERTGRLGDSDARLLIHQSQIGCIIGRGGAKVKELREVRTLPCVPATKAMAFDCSARWAAAAAVAAIGAGPRKTPPAPPRPCSVVCVCVYGSGTHRRDGNDSRLHDRCPTLCASRAGGVLPSRSVPKKTRRRL